MCISVPRNTNEENIYKLSIPLQIVQPSRKKKIVIKFGMLDFTGTHILNIIMQRAALPSVYSKAILNLKTASST